jgi:large subunit ribosomal protein L4
MKAMTYTAAGKKATTEVTLDKAIFGQEVNAELLSLAYRRTLANRRTNNAKTLTRGLVRGGGKKPWRQKGTGRARVGSSRTPLWRTGGIVFGPTGNENYSITMTKKMIRGSVAQALSAQADRIRVIESFKPAESKTRAAVDLLAKLEVEGRVFIVVNAMSEAIARSVANLPGVEAVTPQRITAFDVLNADAIIIEQPALESIKSWLGGTK